MSAAALASNATQEASVLSCCQLSATIPRVRSQMIWKQRRWAACWVRYLRHRTRPIQQIRHLWSRRGWFLLWRSPRQIVHSPVLADLLVCRSRALSLISVSRILSEVSSSRSFRSWTTSVGHCRGDGLTRLDDGCLQTFSLGWCYRLRNPTPKYGCDGCGCWRGNTSQSPQTDS